MVLPEATIEATGKMEHVMRAFERTNAVFLPVVDQERYIGFVAQTTLFDAYRKWLKDTSIQ